MYLETVASNPVVNQNFHFLWQILFPLQGYNCRNFLIYRDLSCLLLYKNESVEIDLVCFEVTWSAMVKQEKEKWHLRVVLAHMEKGKI